MRLGGPVFAKYITPEGWITNLKRCGYSAAFCPVDKNVGPDNIQAYAETAGKENIIIAETGAWSNPLSTITEERNKALALCKANLALAEAIAARCCVNISGSRGEQWDGPHPDNLTKDTFDLVVETARKIIDEVKPTRTFYALETMPWMFPDSADSYLCLIKAVDRKQFAVHFDPVNLICSPRAYFENASLIRDFVKKLGPYIKSCHAKDILLRGNLTVHLDEVRPGLGKLDYRTYLKELDRLERETPLMLEHLATPEEYTSAANYIRLTAKQIGVTIL
ncbi:MAG: TIM barrel protein [Candidatus Omnitrophota bacterium]